jgi:O-antigen/teichoic acid export membrane protein
LSGQDVHILDVLRGASIAGQMKILAAFLAFGLSVTLGRILGADAAGAYFLALATATVGATIARVGMDSALLRSIAGHASSASWSAVRAVHRAALGIGFISACIVAGVLVIGAGFLADRVYSNPGLVTPIRLMALAIVPLSLSVLLSRSLLGLSEVRDGLLVFSIIPSATALIGAWILAVNWGVNGAVVAYVIAVSAALAYGWYSWRQLMRIRVAEVRAAVTSSQIRELLRSGSPLLIGALLQLVIQLSGTVMLGIWAENADVGL